MRAIKEKIDFGVIMKEISFYTKPWFPFFVRKEDLEERRKIEGVSCLI